MTRMSSQVMAVTCGAVLFAVVLSGVLASGLIRNAYDGQAKAVLHREALLTARLVEDRATTAATRAGRPAALVLAGAGVQAVRVRAKGTVVGAAAGLVSGDQTDVSAAAQGRSVQGSRTIAGVRYLVDVEPVDGGGGVLLLQKASDARAVTRGVVWRFVLALLVGLLTAALLAGLLARRLTRPLAGAALAAQRLATGERDVRLAEDGPTEVTAVASSLNSLATSLATSEGRQREFLLSISHELRTPLTAIKGFAEALADRVSTGDAAVAAGRTIEAEANRLQRLVSDLLDLARLAADDFRLDLADVDLGELVREAGEVWSGRCSAVGVVFRLELPDEPVTALTDATRLRQVLDGLAENALRVTPAGRPIVFALALETGGAPGVPGEPGEPGEPGAAAGPARSVLAVRDGGPGLSAGDRAVAFERGVLYERYRGVRQVGTGLGLALAAGLVGCLGGTAEAAEAPEGGAAFLVRLPLSTPGPSVTPLDAAPHHSSAR